jgi:hypothetical protein
MTSPFLSLPLRTRAQAERDEIEASGARVTEVTKALDAPLPDDFDIPAYLRRPAPRRDFDDEAARMARLVAAFAAFWRAVR